MNIDEDLFKQIILGIEISSQNYHFAWLLKNFYSITVYFYQENSW